MRYAYVIASLTLLEYLLRIALARPRCGRVVFHNAYVTSGRGCVEIYKENECIRYFYGLAGAYHQHFHENGENKKIKG